VLAIVIFTMMIVCNLLMGENTQKQAREQTKLSNGINRLICGK